MIELEWMNLAVCVRVKEGSFLEDLWKGSLPGLRLFCFLD